MRTKTVHALRVLTTIVALLVCGKWATAQVALKPTGENALPLRAKSLQAAVRVERSRFASTDLELVFANTLNNRVEADFMYTVPEGAVVTDFAYFFGAERVPARVAEKKRAAAIYKAITDRQRDPALVEMVGKNTFRARIFPVEPNADLRVQIRYVQVLPVGANGAATLSLPLQTPKSVKWDSVNVAVRVARSDAVANNFGLPNGADNAGNTLLSFSGTNYRTDKNLRVSLSAPKPDATPYLAATSGGTNGFFAATITAPVGAKLDAGSVVSSGVPVYALSAKRLSRRDVLITGRYKGTGTARFSVLDAATGKRVSTSPLAFTGAAEANSPATKLWAAAQIERLSRRDTSANRAAGIALSKRFTLPSRWTSWIAIPVSERERMVREEAERQIHLTAVKIYDLRKQGRGKSAQARALEARFFALCKTAQQDDPQEMLKTYLDGFADGEKYEAERRREDRRQAAALPVVQRLYRLIRAGKGSGKEAQALRERFRTVFADAPNRAGSNEPRLNEWLRDEAYDEIEKAAKKTALSIAENGAESAAAKRDRATLQKRCEEVGADAKNILTNAIGSELYNRQRRAVRDIIEDRTQTTEYARMRGEAIRLAAAEGKDGNALIKVAAQEQMERIIREWMQKSRGEYIYRDWSNDELVRGDVPTTPGEVAELRGQIDRLAKATGIDSRPEIERANAPWYREALRQKRDAVVEARQTPDAPPAQIAQREREYLTEARSHRQEIVGDAAKTYYYTANTPDGREAFGKDRLARLAARIEADRLDEQLRTPLSPTETTALQTRVAALRKTETELRARMGDPLLFVDAPRNAKSLTATLPNGEIVPLAWDDAAGRWQCRFDIPTYAAEGDYIVRVEIVLADGTRTEKTFTYTVDTTAPTGTLTTTRTDTGVRVEVTADADTVRALAVLSSGDPVTLTADPARPGRFFGMVRTDGAVTVVITDRAHNRTTLTEGGKP